MQLAGEVAAAQRMHHGRGLFGVVLDQQDVGGVHALVSPRRMANFTSAGRSSRLSLDMSRLR